jgi:serine/threonine-protein kinase PBS1
MAWRDPARMVTPRARADTAADTVAETAAKAVIRSGAQVPQLGEMCERIAHEGDVLGVGAFGVVFRGKLSGLGQVAVKRLGGEGQDAGDFEREVAILQLPEHPNLLRMLACAKCRDARYLVYPFVGGGDLHTYLGSSHPTIAKHGCRVGIAQDVVAGLTTLHTHSPIVLHRDLKPQNVLISMDEIGRIPDGRPRAILADFGLSRFSPELGAASHLQSNHMVGTLGYKAPEILLGQYSTASDVYALGVLLLQCVTGRKALVPAPGGAPVGMTHLSTWVREAKMRGRDAAPGLADPRADFPWRMAEALAGIGLKCCASAAGARPSLEDIGSLLRRL